MRKQIARRLLAALLSLTMAVGLTPSAFAQSGGDSGSGGVTWEEVSSDSVTASPELREAEAPEENSPYADDETVRVSIVLEGEPTIAMFAAEDIAENEDAMTYREHLEEYQEAAAEYISEAALDGDDLDVVWNLTLAANIISANVEYGQIEDIEELDGIEEVIIEPCFSIQDSQTEANPQMSVSTGYAGSGMTNTVIAWENGYKGQGMRIAVIDSGLDMDHQSFNNDAFLHALEEDAKNDGVEVASYNLLDAEEIAGVLEQLNVSKKNPSADASQLYRSEKVPFAYNYIDNNYSTDHVSDNGSTSAYNHGSEVASVVAANRYLKRGDEYVSAMDEVYMTGNAPDAQLVIMKVYGQGGGAYESDYLSALEDAILLGCTAANISIGGYNGFAASSSASYQKIYDGLADTGIVVSVSSCNYGAWADGTSYGKLYSEDVNFQTGGEPGSYANAFTVANVVNNGSVGPQYLSANGISFAYDDATDGNNKALSTLNTSGGDGGTEYEYVFFTGYGSIDDYAGVDVEGKVVFVSRGGGYDVDSNGNAIGNYTTKAHNALDLKNAAALIVYNNVSGSTAPVNFGYDDLYKGTAPAVGITQAAGESIKAASAPMEGRDDVYTGTITIYSGDIMVNIDNTQDYLVFHESSSWGVPGDLTLKPEITAPGSYLWMANGRYIKNGKEYGGTDAYISSYGTSFSAPQIASIAALTQQYINNKGLSQDGLTDRALIQSLLMSTADPLKDGDGNYYSVMQQGAGLVDTAAATSADSYILMGSDATASWQDGKVKAELGDDPGRTGVYSFTFTINNLDGAVHSYTLDADVFTQAVETDGWYTYLSNSTEKLSGAAAAFEILGSSGLSYDFDGNNAVNLDDGNALLDYVTGNRSSLYHQENAGFGRGVVDSYSAHLFLNAMDAVTVPANGSVTIRATITLNQSEMADILYQRWNGAYVEAFVNVSAEPDAEGYEGTSHSIPVLAFYGNWSDASMFDKNSYSEYLYGEWVEYPYLYSANGEYSNYLTVNYAGGGSSYLGVNPFSGLVEKNGYVEGRSALNNQYGDKLGRWYFALIRNAAAGRVLITDAATGEVYLERTTGRDYNAYYDVWNYYWYNTFDNANINWAGTDQNGRELSEGTTVRVTVSKAPELYVDAGGNVNWDALGEGASLSTTVTIDNTAPTITNVSLDGSTVTVTAQDNQYVAAAVLVSSDGRTVVDKATPSQETPNASVSMRLSLAGGVGKTFLVQVYDYACNVRTYRITLEETLEPEQTYRGYEYSTNEWVSYTEEGAKNSVGKGWGNGYYYCAGVYADENVYTFDEYIDFYWMPAEDLSNMTYLNYITYSDTSPYYVLDVAYDATSNVIYVTFENEADSDDVYYGLGKVNLATTSTKQIDYAFISRTYNAYYALAEDDNGTLYGVAWDWDNDDYALYSIDPTALDGYGTGETKLGNIGLADWAAWIGYQSMTWDSENGVLLLAANGFDYDDDWNPIESGSSALYTIQVNGTDDLTVEKKMDLEHPLVSLYTYIPDAVEDGSANVTDVTLSRSSLSLLVGGTAQLTATVRPSDANDNTVVWSSSDESIVRVRDDGLVAARSAGTAVITATSVDNPSASATCEVSVTTLDLNLQALVTDSSGTKWVSFNTENLETFRTIATFDEPLINVAVTDDGDVYAIDSDPSTWYSYLYHIDADFGVTRINDDTWYWGSNYWLYDLAYAPNLNGGMFLAVDCGYVYSMSKNGIASSYFDEYYNNYTYFCALTYVDSYKSGNTTYDRFILIDSNGDVYVEDFYYKSGRNGGVQISYGPTSAYLGSTGYASDGNQYNSTLLATDDSGKQYLLWCPSGSGELVAMEIDLENWTLGSACSVGTFPDGVSVSGLMTADVYPSGTAQQVNQPELPQDAQSEETENVEIVTQTASTPSGMESEIKEEDSAETEPPVEPDEDSSADLAGDSKDGPKEEESDEILDDTETVYESVTSDAAGGSVVSVTDRTAKVRIVLDAASTNGKVKVSYDASVLELTGVTGYAALNSHNDSTDGEVVLAYAYKDAAAAGTVVAELSFASKNETCDTNVTLTTQEDGTEKPAESEQIVPITIGSTEVTDTPDTTPSNPGTSSGNTGSTGAWRPGNTSTTGGTSTSGNTSNQTNESNLADSDTPLDYLPGVSKPAISINVPAAPALDKIPGILAPYIDLNSGSWYNEYAAYVIANGLMAGTASNLFSPDAALSRGMLVTILHRAAGLPAVSVASGFTDVVSGKWYTDAVTWAVLNDLVNGYADGTFQPNADITRQELAVILWRLAKQMGMDVTSDSAVLLNFTDRDEIASWAAEAVAWACQCGILGGYSDGRLAPTAGTSRIEAAAMIARFLELVEKSVDPTV